MSHHHVSVERKSSTFRGFSYWYARSGPTDQVQSCVFHAFGAATFFGTTATTLFLTCRSHFLHSSTSRNTTANTTQKYTIQTTRTHSKKAQQKLQEKAMTRHTPLARNAAARLSVWGYRGIYVLILLAFFSKVAVSTTSSIFKSHDGDSSLYFSSSKKTPPNAKCDTFESPSYTLKEDGKHFFLMVDLHQVSRKNLDVTVDFETGSIDVLAWRFESTKEQNEELLQKEQVASKTCCIHREWQVDRNEETDSFDLEGLVMGLNKDGLLTISVPKLEGSTPTKESKRDTLHDSRKERKEKKQQSQDKLNDTPRLDTNKLRGFQQRIPLNYTSIALPSPSSGSKTSADYPATENSGYPSPKSPQKQLLERFLLVSLTDTEEAAYWLHKM